MKIKMNKNFSREMTKMNLASELNNILNNYMLIYDEYYETGSRDSAFLKDLTDSILGISAVLEVYVRDKYIHPNYAVEKLEFSDSYIKSVIDFYKSKEEYEGGEESEK